MNKKGATQASDFTETLIAIVLILIALLLLFFVASQRKSQVTNAISQVESEAIRMQAVRTYIQTPVLFDGTNISIGELINEYYRLSIKNSLNRTEKAKRLASRDIIYSTAKQIFNPLVQQKLYNRFGVTIKLYYDSADMGSSYWMDIVFPSSSKGPPPLNLNISLPAKLETKYEHPGDYTIFIQIQ